MEPRNFDPSHSAELLKHMDKQNEVLMEAYRSMLHELQKLQVEEEMLMHKMYEVMSAHGLTKKGEEEMLKHKMYEVMSAHGLTKKNDGNANSGAEHSNTEVNEATEEQ